MLLKIVWEMRDYVADKNTVHTYVVDTSNYLSREEWDSKSKAKKAEIVKAIVEQQYHKNIDLLEGDYGSYTVISYEVLEEKNESV